MSTDPNLRRLIARQHGAVHHHQLRDAGLSRSAIRHRVLTERLWRVHHQVFAVGRDDLSPLGRSHAAVLAARCRPGLDASGALEAPLTHISGGRALGVLPEDGEDLDRHVTAATGRRGRRGTLIVHRGRLDPRDFVRRHGLWVSSAERLLLELAETEPERVVRRALGEAEVLGLTTRRDVVACFSRWHGRHGVGVLRDIIGDDLAAAPTRSVLEDEFLPLVKQAGLPRPVTNATIGRYEADAFWPAARLAVELDGRRFHDTDSRFESDRARDARLAATGVMVLRFTRRRLRAEPLAVLAELAAALALRSGADAAPAGAAA